MHIYDDDNGMKGEREIVGELVEREMIEKDHRDQSTGGGGGCDGKLAAVSKI